MNALAVDDEHIVHLCLGCFALLDLSDRLCITSCGQLTYQTVVDLYDDLINIRNDALHQVDAPLFKSLLHNGVVRVCKCLTSNAQRPVKVAALVCQQSDKLRNRNGGMGIVELDHCFVCKL